MVVRTQTTENAEAIKSVVEEKPLVTEKEEFEHREESLITVLFRNMALSRFECREETNRLQSEISSKQKKNFD